MSDVGEVSEEHQFELNKKRLETDIVRLQAQKAQHELELLENDDRVRRIHENIQACDDQIASQQEALKAMKK